MVEPPVLFDLGDPSVVCGGEGGIVWWKTVVDINAIQQGGIGRVPHLYVIHIIMAEGEAGIYGIGLARYGIDLYLDPMPWRLVYDLHTAAYVAQV